MSQPLPVRMVSPRDKRPSAYCGGVLQIHVTRACDKACFGCTQGSNLGGKTGMIPVELFEVACQSLRQYPWIVGVFGGNCCLHPAFPQLCEILQKYIPRDRRGLWSNNLNGHGAICRQTFNPAVSNLNVHLDQRAYAEFQRDWPEALPFGLKEDSRHAPPWVAMQDVIPDEQERWRLIGNCDVNKYWSAMVCVFRGELRGYFCELAGAQAMLHQYEPDYPDHGLSVDPEASPAWWDQPIEAFNEQVRYHCHACGIPLKGRGELAIGGATEQVSQTHSGVYKPKTKGRLVELVTSREQLHGTVARATDYLGNADK